MAQSAKPICILSIDGGGLRGLIPATLLRHLERLLAERLIERRLPSQPLARFFDLIAGTSTGGIIAAALAGRGADDRPLAGLDQLEMFYLQDAKVVFAGHGRGWFRPKFVEGQRELKRRFVEICGEARLAEAAVNLVIPAFTGNGAFLFRGGPGWRSGSQPNYFLHDVLLATTAAPYVFPPARLAAIGQQEIRDFVDGGLFANNPALHAYLDARELFGDARDVLLLSLGTGNDFQPVDYHTAFQWGGLKWINPLSGVPLLRAVMQGQSHDAHQMLRTLIPDQRSYIRLDIHWPRRMPSFDDASPAAMEVFQTMAKIMVEENAELLIDLSERLTSLHVAASGVSSRPPGP
jgi:uncharacterized protein